MIDVEFKRIGSVISFVGSEFYLPSTHLAQALLKKMMWEQDVGEANEVGLSLFDNAWEMRLVRVILLIRLELGTHTILTVRA